MCWSRNTSHLEQLLGNWYFGCLTGSYIKNKTISDECIRKWCIQILQGLDYLHSRNPPIIHKDLKCSNLFIDGNSSSIRIGDLGLASHVNKDCGIAGTLEYMAPETLDYNIYNEKTDMYAFGMCILELLTKSYPYSECSTPSEFFSKVLNVGLYSCGNKLYFYIFIF